MYWPPAQEHNNANWTGERSVGSLGRRVIWQLDAKLGRKEPHRMCSCLKQEEKTEPQLCLLPSCSNRKTHYPLLHNQERPYDPAVTRLTLFKYVHSLWHIPFKILSGFPLWVCAHIFFIVVNAHKIYCFNHFKVHNLGAFSILAKLWNHHHYVLEHFHHLKRKLCIY